MSYYSDPGPPKELIPPPIRQSRGKVHWWCYKCDGTELVSPDVEHLEHRHRGTLYILKKVPKNEKPEKD